MMDRICPLCLLLDSSIPSHGIFGRLTISSITAMLAVSSAAAGLERAESQCALRRIACLLWPSDRLLSRTTTFVTVTAEDEERRMATAISWRMELQEIATRKSEEEEDDDDGWMDGWIELGGRVKGQNEKNNPFIFLETSVEETQETRWEAGEQKLQITFFIGVREATQERRVEGSIGVLGNNEGGRIVDEYWSKRKKKRILKDSKKREDQMEAGGPQENEKKNSPNPD